MAANRKATGPLLTDPPLETAFDSGRRLLSGWQKSLLTLCCIAYALFHLLSLNVHPLESWTFRILHIAGALFIGFLLHAGRPLSATERELSPCSRAIGLLLKASAAVLGAYALACALYAWATVQLALQPPQEMGWHYFGPALFGSALLSIHGGWLFPACRDRPSSHDWILAAGALSVCLYLLLNLSALQFRAGVMPQAADFWTLLTGSLLILELTRRLAGWALVLIALGFIAYGFVGPWLPRPLGHDGYPAARLITYLYTDNGILGPTTAVSSTYIILFIAFAAFLQASRVGDYFVNFAFALAGRARGGPAKVSVLASGLMGMINGTSAGNVVATGSLTIPLMKRVGYRPQAAAAIEATASAGGQVMPPIMGAGAFIMAEITGIPYGALMLAALIPALLYFLSVLFVVDLEAQRLGMKGLAASQLPRASRMLRQAYLFAPVLVLLGTLFLGYSVIRAGTLGLMSVAIVSWLTPHPMGLRAIAEALENTSTMALQLIAVCACAGIIVGIISLTAIGLRFSMMLLNIAEHSQLLALLFAMVISIVLGMGMPTTAAYAIAASVVAPGLTQLGIPPLSAHLFVFYYAAFSAITPPVALAAYAGAAIAGSDPMRTSVTAFRFGLAAFVIPFMFLYSPALLLEGEWYAVVRSTLAATLGIYFLAAAVTGFLQSHLRWKLRLVLLGAAIAMIPDSLFYNLLGLGLGVLAFFLAKRHSPIIAARTG